MQHQTLTSAIREVVCNCAAVGHRHTRTVNLRSWAHGDPLTLAWAHPGTLGRCKKTIDIYVADVPALQGTRTFAAVAAEGKLAERPGTLRLNRATRA